MMHSQFNRAISTAISNRGISEIQNKMGTLSSEQRDTESGASNKIPNSNEGTCGLKRKLTRKNSFSAFDFRDTNDQIPYTKLRQRVFLFVFFSVLKQLRKANDTKAPTIDFLSQFDYFKLSICV